MSITATSRIVPVVRSGTPAKVRSKDPQDASHRQQPVEKGLCRVAGWGMAKRCPRKTCLWGTTSLCLSHPFPFFNTEKLGGRENTQNSADLQAKPA